MGSRSSSARCAGFPGDAMGIKLRGGCDTHPVLDDWFLTDEERGNPSSDISPWTEGNEATPLVHGATYFGRLLEELRERRAGDYVHVLDWRGDDDERLGGARPPGGPVMAGPGPRGGGGPGPVLRGPPPGALPAGGEAPPPPRGG